MLLIIGNSKSIHIYNYISRIMSDETREIIIYDPENASSDMAYKYYYAEKKIRVIYGLSERVWKHRLLHRIWRRSFLDLAYQVIKLRSLGSIDICQVHYMSELSIKLAKAVRKKTKKLIFNFWGSDIFRASEKSIPTLKKGLHIADHIILSTIAMKHEFHSRFGELYDDKISMIKFVTTTIENLRWAPYCKKGSVLVACGYNAMREQQHLQAIDTIQNCSKDIKEKIKLLFLMSYGDMDGRYIETVENALKKSRIDYVIIKDLLTPKQMQDLCYDTDIYLHFAKTDAFSGSMQEMLCAGAVMIKGDWLKYEELDVAGVYYHSIADFTNLPPLLDTVVRNMDEENRKCRYNTELVNEISSIETIRAAYKRILH